MKFNRFIIQHIFETKFWDEIEQQVSHDVQKIEMEDFGEDFQGYVDTLELDRIDAIEVDSYDVEEDSEEQIVTGELVINVVVDGYAYHDGESFAVGTSTITLGYTFSFIESENNVGDLVLEHIY